MENVFPEFQDKLPELQEVIARLASDLKPIQIQTADRWDESIVATGIIREGDPSKVVYVALMLDYDGNIMPGDEFYFYDCEVYDPDAEIHYRVVGHGEEATYEELRSAVLNHLSNEQSL